MARESIEKKSNEPWQPKKDFFLSNPRSKELREVCIEIIKRVRALANDSDKALSAALKGKIYAQLEHLNGKLIELGVTPNMQSGKNVDYYRGSPVASAEWIAGQLVRMTDKEIVSETQAKALASEFGKKVGDQYAVENATKPTELRNFSIQSGVINVCERMLDAEDAD